MNLPQKTKHIYLELRNVLGDGYPTHSLLESAALLLELIEVKNPITADQMRDFWEPFAEKGVDEIILDNCKAFYPQEELWVHKVNKEEVDGLNYSFKSNDFYEYEVAV